MAANPVMIKNTVTITWDGVAQRIPAGTVLDSPAGGGLLTAIGGSNYVALSAQQTGGSPGLDENWRNSNVRNGGEPYGSGQN